MFTGGFSAISNSVSDSKPASVSGSGSGADSVSGSGAFSGFPQFPQVWKEEWS